MKTGARESAVLNQQRWMDVRGQTGSVGRFGAALDELVEEGDLAFLFVDDAAHVHAPDVRVIRIVVRERAVVSLVESENQ